MTERGVLRQHYETDALDASTLLAAIFGFLPADDERLRSSRARHRRRAHRARLRAALPHRRDRRRPVGQGGHVPDLLVLARLRAGDHRRDPARARPDGAAAAHRLAARACTPRSSTSRPAATSGNFPQAFSHLALIEAAARIIARRAAGGAELMSAYDVIIIGTGAGGGTLAHTSPRRASASCCSSAATGCRASRTNWDPADGVRRQPLHLPGHLVRRRRQAVPAAGPLLRRRRDEALRRGAVPAAPGGLRRAAPPRRHLAGLADHLRRLRAVLHAGRAALPGARQRAARTRPSRRPARRTRSRRSRTSRGSSSSPTTSPRAGYHPFHAPCGILLDEADMPYSTLHPLHVVRRLPVPGARQVRRRGARRAARRSSTPT